VRKIWSYGLASISAGIIIILVSLLIEESNHPTSHLPVVLLKLSEHLGIALISIGLVGIIVDFRDWQKYFQERIADTIIQREYLKTLDQSELISLQTNSLKAFFKVDDIDRKDSFLDFFHRKIQNSIGSPYREDINEILSITFSEDKKFYIIEETLSYRCRKVGDSIQDRVQWFTSRETDSDTIEDFQITVQIPQNFFQSSEFKARFPKISGAEKVFDMKDNKDGKLIPREEAMGYALSLDEYTEIDELIIKFHIKYNVSIGYPIAWRITQSSKNLTITVNYPMEFKIDVNIFGMEESECVEVHRSGLYIFRYDSWLLANSGLVFHLLNAGEFMHQ
jgi:hypothetical protein